MARERRREDIDSGGRRRGREHEAAQPARPGGAAEPVPERDRGWSSRAPSSRLHDEYGRPGGADQPTWGERWGMVEQGDWRGPGEMPGYRATRTARGQFLQSDAGGQIPAERREWDGGPPAEHGGEEPSGTRR